MAASRLPVFQQKSKIGWTFSGVAPKGKQHGSDGIGALQILRANAAVRARHFFFIIIIYLSKLTSIAWLQSVLQVATAAGVTVTSTVDAILLLR